MKLSIRVASRSGALLLRAMEEPSIVQIGPMWAVAGGLWLCLLASHRYRPRCLMARVVPMDCSRGGEIELVNEATWQKKMRRG